MINKLWENCNTMPYMLSQILLSELINESSTLPQKIKIKLKKQNQKTVGLFNLGSPIHPAVTIGKPRPREVK